MQPESQQKIDELTSGTANQRPMLIDLLMDRSQMLLGLRSRLSLMNRALRDLVQAISIPLAQ